MFHTHAHGLVRDTGALVELFGFPLSPVKFLLWGLFHPVDIATATHGSSQSAQHRRAFTAPIHKVHPPAFVFDTRFSSESFVANMFVYHKRMGHE